MISALLGDFIPWLIGISALVASLGYARWSGAKAAKNKAKVKRLEADKATSERISNAKPAETVDDAKSNLAGFLRRGK